MWIFLPGGLLMPADVPMDLADPKFTEGKYDLQVRARLVEHLQDFMDNYMEPGTFSEIQRTPKMDYNARFYTTREAFAAAMTKAIADIDYEKFKPTAKGRKYHDLLNTMWGSITALAPAYEALGFRGTRGYFEQGKKRRTGSTFGTIATVDDQGDLDQDWTPGVPATAEQIIGELERANIPLAAWPDYLTSDAEWLRIEKIWTRRMLAEKKQTAKVEKTAKKNYKRS